MKRLGWTREIVSLPNINKKEARYFKDGFEITEDQLKEIVDAVKLM